MVRRSVEPSVPGLMALIGGHLAETETPAYGPLALSRNEPRHETMNEDRRAVMA